MTRKGSVHARRRARDLLRRTADYLETLETWTMVPEVAPEDLGEQLGSASTWDQKTGLERALGQQI